MDESERKPMTRMTDTSHGRRHYERKHVLLGGRFLRGVETVSCLVTDISANGARIMLDRCPDGDRLGALHIDRFGLFAGELRWSDDGSAGIRFLDRSEEHTSELQSLMRISYAVFCSKKKQSDNSDTKTYIHATHISTHTLNNNLS